MNLIEEAAKRLRQLEQAGIEVPPGSSPASGAQAEKRSSVEPIPQQVVRAAQVDPGAEGAADRRLEPRPSARVGSRNFHSIDLERLEAAGFITPAVPDSKLLHEFRVIKRPLIENALGKSAAMNANGNLIMVTSALPGEGKSFVSLNLAMCIAMEVDSTVLLVDADVVAPSMPKLLGLPTTKGLLDVLTGGDVGFADVLLRTNVDRLALVQAGTPQRGASELLASEAMTQLLKEVSSRYRDRIVIFDSPPLLATTESRVLASRVGQVVVVVEAERTTHQMLESALSMVESCPIVLTMLNKASKSDHESYYGYPGYGR